MKANLLRTFFVMWMFLTTALVSAQDAIPDKPSPPRLINDFAQLLSEAEVNALEQKLVRFDDSTSTQIVVVTVSDLQGYDVTDFADRLGEKWGVGQKGKDNGVVVLIKPKIGTEQGKARISVGYGLEGAIPDATARRIVDNEMIPYFKKNQYYQGIDAALNILISLSKGEFSAEQYNKRSAKNHLFAIIIPFVILLIIFISMFNNKRRKTLSPGKSLPFWILLGMMGSGGGSHGSWGGSSGSSGGGSFGGFGGGSFGGGGASGSW